jgi:hypothetical protein
MEKPIFAKIAIICVHHPETALTHPRIICKIAWLVFIDWLSNSIRICHVLFCTYTVHVSFFNKQYPTGLNYLDVHVLFEHVYVIDPVRSV